ncbi:MAG: DUF1697 domain-containing protein [Dermatophilaceae bacterium]
MPTYIAFLRAVNVAPRWVKMARVNTLLPEHGYAEVATHIQSGNLRVTTPTRSAAKVASHLRTVLSEEFGFDIPTIVRTPAQLRELVCTVDGMPAPLADARVYIAFLAAHPSATAREQLDGWDTAGERAAVVGPHVVIWLNVPFHKARLTNARIEKIAGIATTRDLKVVRTLADRWGA